MNKYIALLRGINVGGNNKISMKELKELLEENNYKNVSSYLNSGNIIFLSEKNETELIKVEFEKMILEKFGLNIAVLVISAEDFCITLKNAPDWWDKDTESKHNAIFVIPPTTAEQVCNEVGEIKPEYEKVFYFNQVVFWSAPIATFSRTRWSKVVGTKAYNSITIRNANTVKKLAKLSE